MRARWIIAALALALVVAPAVVPAAAQPTCSRDSGKTFNDCFNEVYQNALAAAAAKEGRKTVEKAALPAATPEARGTAADFISRLFTSLDIGELSEEEGSQTLSFNLTKASKSAGPSPQAVLKVVRRDAELLEAFVKKIPEAIRAQRKESLEEQLDDFDDVEIGLSVAFEGKLMGRQYGRGFRAYGAETQTVFNSLQPDLQPDNQAIQRLLGVTQGFQISQMAEVAATFTSEPTKAPKLEAAVIAAAQTEAANTMAFQKGLDAGNYFKLAELVANQPQLHFEASYRSRDDLVGPDEWGLEATYEHGFGNINGLRAYAKNSCGGSIVATVAGKSCYQKYLEDNKGKIKSSNRLKISAEYGEADALRLELPADDVLFELDAVRKAIGSLAWGRSITTDDKGADTSRFDLEAKYEDVSGDEKRNNRFVVTATFTQNVINGNVLSLGIVHANKPEYLGEVDKELSARVGLKFKLDKKQ